jgi:hypothetical protein
MHSRKKFKIFENTIFNWKKNIITRQGETGGLVICQLPSIAIK